MSNIGLPDRKKALDSALHQIEKSFGKGSIMRLGDNAVQQIEVIPSGSLGLDFALGVGGIPRGRVTESLRPGKLRQNHTGASFYRRNPETGRHCRFYRRRACP